MRSIDANCQGYHQRQQEIVSVTGDYSFLTACAVPDSHIRHWLLLDGAAFKKAPGKSCDAPDQKCDRDRYKRLSLEAIRDAGVTPIWVG